MDPPKAPIQLKKALSKELICPVCQDRLEVPKSLNCLHCFCRKCLDEIIAIASQQDKTSFECPTCREPHRILPIGSEAYKTNFVMANLVEVVQLHESEEKEDVIKCNNSNDNNPAVQYCGECQTYLCEACVVTHSSMKATRKHKIVAIEEIKKDPRKMVQRRYCTKHDDEELKLFCEDLEEVICRDCDLDDDHRGKNHTHRLIGNVHEELKKNLEKLVEAVSEKHDEFEQHINFIDDVKKQSSENIAQCKENIATFFKKYRARLEACEEQLQSKIDEFANDSSKHTSTELEAVRISKVKLETAKQYTQKLLDTGSPVDIAMMSKQAKKRLMVLRDEKWDRNTIQVSRWGFVGNDDNPFQSNIRGGINRSEIKVSGLTQPVSGKNTFKVQLVEGVESGTSPTVTLTRNGERLQEVTVVKEDNSSWNVQYNIPGEGEYEIGVAMDGVEAERSPFKRIWRDKLTKGTKVDRGRDWKWGDQNGGAGNHGTVLGWAGEVGASENWVKVKWRNGRQNNYRWGAENAYDLMILSMPDLKFVLEELEESLR